MIRRSHGAGFPSPPGILTNSALSPRPLRLCVSILRHHGGIGTHGRRGAIFSFPCGRVRVQMLVPRHEGRSKLLNTMWKGRFTQDTSSLVQQFGESISYDWRLFPHDIAGSIAHARAQKIAGLLTDREFAAIEGGLQEIAADIVAGTFEFKTSLEDIHMNIEAELTRRIGPAGAKLHTARSRNDQVATDTRLYCRTEIDGLLEAITGLQHALLDACGTIRRHRHSRLHPPPARPTGHRRPPFPRLRRNAGARQVAASPIAASASTFPRSAPARWPARPSISTATPSPPNSASTASPTTRWTPSPTATTSPSCFSSSRSAASTSRASART